MAALFCFVFVDSIGLFTTRHFCRLGFLSFSARVSCCYRAEF